MPRCVVFDSDDEEELSLELDTTPEVTSNAPDRSYVCSDSPDELGPQQATSSTERLLREAKGPLFVDSCTPTSKKRKSENRAVAAEQNDVWDIPKSSPTMRQQRPLTSSEIRRKYDDTPTEAAPSSILLNERMINLSRTTASSAVSFDGVQDVECDPADDVVIMVPRGTPTTQLQMPRKTVARSLKRAREEKQDDNDELTKSDEKAIGRPREMYKPRPSRRRGSPSPVVDDLESIERQKAKKPRTKRRRANDDTDLPQKAISDGTAQLVDMGFSPGKAQSAVKQMGGDIERAIGMLVSCSEGGQFEVTEDADNPISVQASPATMPGRNQPARATSKDLPKKHRGNEVVTANTIDPRARASSKSPQVSTKKKRGRPKKNAEPKSTLTGLEQEEEFQVNTSIMSIRTENLSTASTPSPAKEQEKGYGRSGKKVATTEALSAEFVGEDDEPRIVSEHDSPLEEIKIPNDMSNVDSGIVEEADKENSVRNGSSSSNAMADIIPSIKEPITSSTKSLRMAHSEDRASPAVRSPRSSASAPLTSRYRIGLSKKSRFPSLLTKFRNSPS